MKSYKLHRLQMHMVLLARCQMGKLFDISIYRGLHMVIYIYIYILKATVMSLDIMHGLYGIAGITHQLANKGPSCPVAKGRGSLLPELF